MYFNNLPEPWDVQIFSPGEGSWRKLRGCRNVYIHLCGSGGAGGAGQSGTSGTKRGGGGAGTASSVTNYYGPSIAFDDYLFIKVPGTATANGQQTSARFSRTVEANAEFVAFGGVRGNAGAGGVGGAGGVFVNGVSFSPSGIVRQQHLNVGGGSVSTAADGGYRVGDPTNPHGASSIGPYRNGAGGGGITDTLIGTLNSGTRGGYTLINGGEGNGFFDPAPAINYTTISGPSTTEGEAGVPGKTLWYKDKPFYFSSGGSGANPSISGTGGRGGDGGIGCGGGGGGAGVTGGAAGLGGHGIAIVISW